MRIIIEDRNQEDEDEVIIRCKELDESILKLINAFKMGYQRITATQDGNIVMIDPKDIYYFESVDNKVFVYTKHDVYETKRKLYEIEQEFEGSDFFRASKSSILNLSKVKSLTPAFNGRFEALLQNNEKIIISRQYVNILKRKLDL